MSASNQWKAKALSTITSRQGWEVLRSPEYAKQAGAFRVAVEAVIEAALHRDQGEALGAYNALVSSCVECHRYVARARIARGDPGAARPSVQ